MLFKLMTLVHLCAAFPLKCPEAAQWRLRANSHCADSSKYLCLWDDNIKEYSENCTRFDFQKAGRKSVLRGGIDADECSKERYQPSGYTLYTNASTNCILLKSFCNEEGQVVYEHGNSTTDATCVCNYRQGFAFLIKPNNPCYCKPSQEDCSCFLKICSNSSHILSPDYKCTIDSDLPPVSNCRAITDENDNNGRRPNITETFPRDDNYVTVPGRNLSALVVLSIFGGAIFVDLLVIFVPKLWRYYFRDLRKKGPEPELRLIEGDPLILQYMLPIRRQRLRLFKDDKYIAEKVNLKKNVFTIENVTQVDEGNYFAQVFYTRSRITKVTVQSMFTSEFNPISCVEGDELQLKCSVYAEDVLVEWIKNNMNIEQNENTSIKRAGKCHCLTFQQAKLSDAGKYSMVARNVSKQQTVTIKAMFTSEFNTLYCIEGEKLQLTCSVYSEAIDVEWLFQDNTKIENNKTTSIGSDGKNHFMTIQCAKSSDSGQYIIVAGNVRKRLMVTVSKDKRESKNLYMRRNLTEARGKCYSAQRKGIFNWKLLKKSLNPIDIIDCFITSGFVTRDLWDFIIKDSMRSQMDSILSYALKNIQTSDDYDKFEKLVVKCNRNILLKTPNDEHDESIQVHGMAEHRFRENRELIEKELYPKDYIDSFLVRFIISLVDHEELRNKENIREQMASTFLEIIQQQAYIAKGSMKCLIYSFKEIDSKVLKCLAKLMDSDLLNGNSKFTADEELQKIIVDRNDCRISIVCKWTYLKDNLDPKDMIDKLYIAGLVDEDRKDIIRDKPRREKVYSTLRNIIRRIDGKSMFLKLKSILEEENPFIYKELNVKAAKRELPCRQDYEIKQLQLNLQKLEKDIQAEFDKNYIDHFVEYNVFDIDDHEIILEATHSENGRAKCFFEKISSIQYIERGSVDCLAECLLGSKNRKNTRNPLARLLFEEQMPEQEINRTHININPEEETLFTNKTDKLTKATSRLAFGDTDIKDAVENATFDVVTTSSFEFEGLQSKPEDTKRSSVVIYLQSDGENVKFIVEKSIVNGDFTTFIMNLLDDEQIKMHMSPEKKYKLSVSIHSKDQQTESNLDHDNPKMRIIKANRKLLEEEYDPMPLLKAVFAGNLEKYKSIENLSPENVADFKQQFSEINEIPERRKRVKQFLNIAEDLVEANKLWELIEDTGNTFSMKKMRDDLNSEQNYNSSSDEGLIFEGKYEVWKTEEDVKSPLQSFILQESKKRVLPEAINRLQEKDRTRYIELMQSSEVEKRYYVRIMVVGKESVGKTSLVRRLLMKNIDDVVSTDGVDIVVDQCKINIEDGSWLIDGSSDDKIDRISRALNSIPNKRSIKEESNISRSKESNNGNKQVEDVANSLEDMNNTTLYQTETSTNMVDRMSANSTSKGKLSGVDIGSRSMSTSDTKDTDQTENYHEGDIKDIENLIKTGSKDALTEHDDTNHALSLVMPRDLMSRVFTTTSASNIPSNHYALCGLWDFAGQKEFYATHQAFLTNSAIYLVVADMKDDISKQDASQYSADFKNVGEYVDFWFDTIHCHRSVEPPEDEPFNEFIDPPVILVLTGKDKCGEETIGNTLIEERKTKIQTQLDMVLGDQHKYHHLRDIICLSNTTDPDVKFVELQQKISSIILGMAHWGQHLPLKWILLEHLIEINKTDGNNFINFSDMGNLAKHNDINMKDIDEVKLFLRFQHEVGNVIYFEDIQDFIILNPKWLVDAFRCLVSDKIDGRLQHRTDWTKFKQTGTISESLITELFKSKCGNQFLDQRENLFKVMEKFDILVKIAETSSYIMPSMMTPVLYDEVCTLIGIKQPNCKRSSWLCLKFSFLPPAFFNHVSVWFIKEYESSKVVYKTHSLALFRGICVFDIDSKSGCEKILVTMSKDTIAIQLLSFLKGETEFGSKCSSVCKGLIKQIQAIKDRYRLSMSCKIHFKCSEGDYSRDTKSYEDLKSSTEYYCSQHTCVHQSEEIYLPWMLSTDNDATMENNKSSQGFGKNEIHQEELNYIRMSLLLMRISPCAVRAFFDSIFHPSLLGECIDRETNKLNDLKNKRIISQTQWNLLFPRTGSRDSKMFDMTLMITLLTNIAKLNHYSSFPVVTDTTPAADMERIKYYRNHIAHNTDGQIDNSFFNTAWDDITGAVGRLGGKHMLDECKEVKTKKLENSSVPWSIEVQISTNLFLWRMTDSTFVETRASKHVWNCVQENSCVTITASGGVGKTAILQHVTLKMADEGYKVLIVNNTKDIVRFYNPNQKTLYVMDNFCGTYSINQFELNCLESVIERIKHLITNKLTKIIVACRLQVYQDPKFEVCSMFRTCVCNLQSKYLRLSQTEKLAIANLYLETKAAEIMQYCDLYECFPLICKVYNVNHVRNVTDFFKNPFSIYENEVDSLIKKGCKGKYCVLALLVMFNNRLKEEWLTEEVNKKIRTMIRNTCEVCRLDRATSRLVLLDELKTLEYTFIKKDQGVYKTIHDKLFDFLSYYFGQKMIHCLIKNADSELIMQRLIIGRKDNMDQFITIVPPQYHDMYLERMIDDWSEGMMHCVFNNINMKILEFRQRFLGYLNTLDISLQRQLALICGVNNQDTVLLQCCQYDDIPLVQWCISHGVDVNQCNYKGMSPLYISAQEGLTKVVMFLLDNKVDINKCTDDGASPLFVACQKNRIEIVKLLLDKKADIDKGMDDATSPLLIAKKMNHIDIVRMLEENGASE